MPPTARPERSSWRLGDSWAAEVHAPGPHLARTADDRARVLGSWTTVAGVPMFALVTEPRAPVPPTPIVFVHGLMVASDFLRPMLVRMGDERIAVAPDLPGYGRSEDHGPPVTIERLAASLGDWIDHQGYPNVELVGCSFGTQVATELAARRPELVEHLALVGPVMAPSLRRPLVAIARWALQLPLELRQTPITIRDFVRGGLPLALATFRALLAYRLEERLGGLTMPTLILRGGLDTIVPQAWAANLASALPDGRLRVLPGRGHAVNFNAPDALAEVLRGFLGRPPAEPAEPAGLATSTTS